jgi:hypothetical protein
VADSSGIAYGTILFGQAPRLTAYWHDNVSGIDSQEAVKWEIINEEPFGASPDGLYPSKTVVLFTEGDPTFSQPSIEFQTVHAGQLKIKATTLGTSGHSGTIELDLGVVFPSGLKEMANTVQDPYDDKVIFYANKYGIPPQYIKSQVYRESRRGRNDVYNATAYRYEMKSFDMDHYSDWDDSDWQAGGLDQYKLPGGALVRPADLKPRHEYSFTAYDATKDQAGQWPYTCGSNDAGTEPHLLFEIYKANDGWFDGSYPNLLYGRVGPCDKRYRWMWEGGVIMAWHAGKYYCGFTPGSTETCDASAKYYQWWLNNSATYPAQTVVAASYGLMQTMYETAVKKMRWNKDQGPDSRHPSQLFDPDTSLNLGVAYDAQNMSNMAVFFYDMADFRTTLGRKFQEYDPGKVGYGDDIVQKAPNFLPY